MDSDRAHVGSTIFLIIVVVSAGAVCALNLFSDVHCDIWTRQNGIENIARRTNGSKEIFGI